MKHHNALLVTYLTLLAIIPLVQSQNPTGCIDSVTDGTDYFPDKVMPSSSEFWDITYFDTYKILTNEIEDETYLLYQCGTEPPTEELEDGRQYSAVIPIPLPHGVALSQTTHIPNMEVLGLRTLIKGYIGDAQYISSPCVNQLIDDGEVVVVGNVSDAEAVDGLLTSSGGEDLVAFVSPFDTTTSLVLNNTVIVSAFEEKTNEAIYEWNKFYSAFFNLEATANELYDEVTANYNCIAENAARVVTDANMQPTVLWAYYSTFSNGWDVAECPNYYCEYADICSAELLNSFEGSIDGFEGNKLMTLEEFVEFGKEADHWIFPSGDWDDVYANNSEALDQFKSVQNKQVFDYQGSGSNAWFENRLVEFDVVAQDFCEVVGTQDPFHTRVWFRNVFTEQVGDPGTCADVNAPLESRATECMAVPPAPALTSGVSTVTIVTALLMATTFSLLSAFM